MNTAFKVECLHNGYHQPGQCPEATEIFFLRPEPPVTRIMGVDWGIPRIIRRCYSDTLPMMLDMRAAGVPIDFCSRVHDNIDRWNEVEEDAAIEQANLGEYGFAQVPDPS
jgi:hypothetical protein